MFGRLGRDRPPCRPHIGCGATRAIQHDVLADTPRIVRRQGHDGTLDRFASGVAHRDLEHGVLHGLQLDRHRSVFDDVDRARPRQALPRSGLRGHGSWEEQQDLSVVEQDWNHLGVGDAVPR